MHSRAILLCIGLCPALSAQVIMRNLEPGGSGRLFPSDAAVLDLREVRDTLPCVVKPVRPELGFDLAFHTGYEVHMRLRDLAGPATSVVTAIFRVTPDSNPDHPVYFEQKWRVPPIPEDAAGSTSLEGAFDIGEGAYQVDWLMRDRHERVCSAFWRISSRMPARESFGVAGLNPGSVVSTGADLYSEPEISRSDIGQGLSVAILLNVAPSRPDSTVLSPADSDALLAILRGIGRDSRIGRFSVTAFNFDVRRVIFQKENVRETDFPSLKKAMGALKLGTVSIGQLAEKNAEARFLVQLAAEQIQGSRPDAMIFVGPKTPDETAIDRDLLNQLGEVSCPVFYLTYTTEHSNVWRDLIGSAVKYWRGREFSISRPVDLVSAWSKIMSQLRSENPTVRALAK